MAAPILFGRRMKRMSNYTDSASWQLRSGIVTYVIDEFPSGLFPMIVVEHNEVMCGRCVQSLPAAIRSLERMRNRLVKSLSKVTNSQEGDEVR
jgi:hypothetical protein